MKKLLPLLVLVAPAFLAGCGNGDQAEMKTDPQKVMNPGGNAATLPPEAQGMAEKQKAAGEAASRNMDEMARKMKEAQARAGGK